MISLQKLNNEIVRPTKFQMGYSSDNRPIKGEQLFSEIYANIFLLAKKKSGKSCCINTIVKKCATKDSTIIVFCSTVDKDMEHLALRSWCENRDIQYVSYTSIKDEDVDVLEVLINKKQDEAKLIDEDEDDDLDGDNDIEKPRRKSKYKAPEYILIFDDLSNELRNKNLIRLMKMNRHFKMKIIISSQYIHDLLPEQIRQLDFCLLFKGETVEKLAKLHHDLDLALDLELFKKIYNNATEYKYHFLYIDVRNETYRRDFNYKYNIHQIK